MMNMTRMSAAVLLALAPLLVAVPSFAQDKGGNKPGVAATVNGKEIPTARIDAMMKQFVAQGRPDTQDLRAQIRQELIARELVVQEAQKKGIDKNPEVAQQIEMARQQIMANAYMMEYLRTNQASDDVLRKEYDRQKSLAGDKELKLRHILVETEDEAKKITAQIKGGGSFEKIAAEKSKDRGSAERGGDLDWAPPANYVKPFADAALKLKKGQLTDAPVQSQFGWHVVRLDDERPLKFPAFDESKQRLQQGMQQQTMQKLIQDLRSKAKIVE